VTLPARYGVTTARALARDPWCVFVYWEAEGAAEVRLGAARAVASDAGSHYFAAEPGREYVAEVLDRGGRVLATSNRVRTPRVRAAVVEATSRA